jgi:hypothetical protein
MFMFELLFANDVVISVYILLSIKKEWLIMRNLIVNKF